MLPTFLGLGVQKAGTSWLHRLLASHPDVWMPVRRKEVSFFSKHYEKGLSWYEQFFPSGNEVRNYLAVGEITPDYLYGYHGNCAIRIADVPSIQQLIVSLRNPVDRAYAGYGHYVRNYNYRRPFEDFIEEWPHHVEMGFYARHLERYLEHFDREQFLVLLFEHLFDDVNATKQKLATFLNIRVDRFPDQAGRRLVNSTYVPRFRRAFSLAQSGLRALRRWKMGRVIELTQRSGLGPLIRRTMGKRAKEEAFPPMQPDTRKRLAEDYLRDIERLEMLIDRDLSIWKEVGN